MLNTQFKDFYWKKKYAGHNFTCISKFQNNCQFCSDHFENIGFRPRVVYDRSSEFEFVYRDGNLANMLGMFKY